MPHNISFISWRSVLLVEEIRVPRENNRPAASHWQTLSHNVVHRALSRSGTHNISGDRNRLHSKCNYHQITAMTASLIENITNHYHMRFVQPSPDFWTCNCKIKMFYYFYINKYLCWWTSSPRDYHMPGNLSFGTDMVY